MSNVQPVFQGFIFRIALHEFHLVVLVTGQTIARLHATSAIKYVPHVPIPLAMDANHALPAIFFNLCRNRIV